MPLRAKLGIACAALLLIGARALAPLAVQRYVNRVLDRTPGYRGRIGDVDLALLRGAYTIESVALEKDQGRVPVPFFRARQMDLSVEWGALLHGAVVGEIWLDGAELNFVAGPTSADRQAGTEADWRDTVERLLPIRLDRLTVRHGAVHFRDFHSDPPVDVYLHDVDLVVHNLTNSRKLSSSLVARGSASAVPKGGGHLQVRLAIDPYAGRPTFDVQLEATGVPLRDFNDLFRAYAGFDVERGWLRVYAELVAQQGAFRGYAKPFVEKIKVLDPKRELEEQSLQATLWEALLGGTAEALEDRSHDRLATRIPIAGRVESPEIGFWRSLANVLRNAFYESFVPGLEHGFGPESRSAARARRR